jgi:hypothetical protein
MQMKSTNKPHSQFRHVYPVVRIDLPLDQETPESSIAVVKVFTSQEAAQLESTRLNELNKDKACKYISCISRLMPDEEMAAGEGESH